MVDKVTDYFKTLKNIKDQLILQTTKNEQECNDLERQTKEIDREKKHLKNEIRNLEIKRNSLQAQIEKRKEYTAPAELTDKMKKFSHNKLPIIQEVIDKFANELLQDLKCDLLSCPREDQSEIVDTKEIYKVYGLFLSACNLKKMNQVELPSVAVDQVVETAKKNNVDIQTVPEKHIEKAISLTRDMLTILPPLVVCTPAEYDEDIQDTNRLTWNEDVRVNLIYYRPVLVYGNQLQVAVKGLVGNSEVPITSPSDRDPESSLGPQGSLSSPKCTFDQGEVQCPPGAPVTYLHHSHPLGHNEGHYQTNTQPNNSSGTPNNETGEINSPGTDSNRDESSKDIQMEFDPLKQESQPQDVANPSTVTPPQDQLLPLQPWPDYYFNCLLIKPDPGNTHQGPRCSSCRQPTYPNFQEVYQFPSRKVLHKKCFKCYLADCSNKSDEIIFFCEQTYCQQHHDCIMCPYCNKTLNRGHCQPCNAKWLHYPSPSPTGLQNDLSNLETRRNCFVCDKLTTEQDSFQLKDGGFIHNECFMCCEHGCGKQLSQSYPEVMFFFGQVYCRDHKYRIKCPQCRIRLTQNYPSPQYSCAKCHQTWQLQ